MPIRDARKERDALVDGVLNQSCANCPHRIGDHAAFANESGHWVCMIEGCGCDGAE